MAEHYFDDLKFILSRIRTPRRLDDHPWAKSLTVREAVKASPSLKDKSPGVQLTHALAELFRQTMPPTPPQGGKRLDTRWGRFGILAANYFAPLQFGRLYPRSLLDAWRRIDQAILLFVYGKPDEELNPEQVGAYRLVGDELAFPANSTISDWHRQGLQDLADLFASREQSLSASLGQPALLMDAEGAKRRDQARRRLWRWGTYVVLAAILLALALGATKGYRIYQQAQAVRGDVAELQGLSGTSITAETIGQAGSLIAKTHGDLAALKEQVGPWLWVTRRLGWVPTYGGDLRSAGDLLDMGVDFTQAATQTYQAVTPMWDAIHQDGRVKAAELTQMLVDARPALLAAQASLGRAIDARGRIPLAKLSPTHAFVVKPRRSVSRFNGRSPLCWLVVARAAGGQQ